MHPFENDSKKGTWIQHVIVGGASKHGAFLFLQQ